MGGSIREYAESANGNVAPSTVISHINGPSAVAFSSTEGIGIANGNIESGGQAALQTFGLAGDFLTGISCFPKPSQTNAVAFDSKGQLFVSAFLPEGGRAVEVFAPGANGCVKPKRTISDEGGLAIDSNNLLYVANSKTATIDIFPAGSSTMQAQIGGSNTGLGAPGSGLPSTRSPLTLRATSTSSILRLLRSASSPPERTGNVAPIRTISGSNTGLTEGMVSASD